MTAFTLHDTATIGDALHHGSACLREVGVGTGNVEAALLLSRVTGLDRLGLINHIARALSPKEMDDFAELVNRRATREPLQYITGRCEFMGLELEVNPTVLIPRPDTEILVEAILDAEEIAGAREGVRIADMGTGSGAIAVALASYLRYAELVATDISPEALDVARANAARHGVGDRVDFRLGDGLAPLAGEELTYLISNPPYIPMGDLIGLDPEVRDWEPHLALCPGEDGLSWYRCFVADGTDLLAAGGMLALEVGMDQAPDVVSLLEIDGRWDDVQTHEDLAGIERVVTARKR